MSLQIWLPLTKDLRQQGLSEAIVTNNGTTYLSSGGKLGGTYSATISEQIITIDLANLSTMLANGKTYTLTCWVKPTGTPSSGWVIKLGNNSCGLWWAKSEARWVWNENDNGKRCANPTISADYTNWHHLAIVVDKTVSGKIITQQYVDGVLAAGYPGSTWDCSSHSQPAGTIITISPYVSQLNDIRLYNHCLSPMEVKELAKGLVLHYPLNQSTSILTNLSDTIEYDCSGYCNNGKRIGTFTWSNDTPKYIMSTVFSGSQRIEAPWNPNGSSSFTVAGWFYNSSGTTYYGAKNTNNSYICLEQSKYFVYNSSASVYVGNYTSTRNVWQHIVLVHDIVTMKLKLYINGSFVNEVATNGTIYNSDILDIGGRLGTAQYNGKMSDFRIYTTALSADDIKSLYQDSAYIDSSGNIYSAVYMEV